MDGTGFDDHKKIMENYQNRKHVGTLSGHNYTGPYNPLEKQVEWDEKTGRILKIHQPPTGKTDAVAMQNNVQCRLCCLSRKFNKRHKLFRHSKIFRRTSL